MKNEVLMPARSALIPPRAGPTPAATKMTVCRAPSLEPARSYDELEATSAVAAGTVPVRVPCKSLRPRSCHGPATKPIDPTTTAAASVARRSMSLRPSRSESLPHSGATRAMDAPDAPFMKPAQAAARPGSSTPSCWT
jgi:hypothetical protein